jgi:hypothetical protein
MLTVICLKLGQTEKKKGEFYALRWRNVSMDSILLYQMLLNLIKLF